MFNDLTSTATLLTSVLLLTAGGGESILGTAQNFAVLGGSTVTSTGPTVLTGDLGVSPGASITGFPPGLVVGVTHAANAVAVQAQSDVATAYDVLAGLAPTATLTGQDLGGLTLAPGVYRFDSSAFLSSTLTLDAMGDPDARFVFQIGSTLITANGASVVTMNAGDGCNVFWQVGSSATLGTDTAFTGNILALASITLNTRASIIHGRALARNGAVTLDSNVVDASCIPGPGAAMFVGLGVMVVGARARRRGAGSRSSAPVSVSDAPLCCS